MEARTAIARLRELKRECELEISAAIYPILRKFEDDSGMNAVSVRVDMMDVTSIQDNRVRYAPGNVEIEVERI